MNQQTTTKFKADIPIEYLRSVLDYDAETGRFTWIRYDGFMSGVFRGLRADGSHNSGYRIIDFPIYGRYMAHRVAWAWVHGEWPTQIVDHINRVRYDNRIENLRQATREQNMANKTGQRLGLKGVTFAAGRWKATIRPNRKNYTLGYYDTEQRAHEVYCVAAKYFFGEFATGASKAPAAVPEEPRTEFQRFMRVYLRVRKVWNRTRDQDWPAGLPQGLREALQRELGDRE